uniref:AlNc14C402G11385 protein n=1 Tax=Albugo laibachii Nc14 TaxID=890382 RepID=F0WYX3_9STRA|nr:AlNc14C402G11385 [Albugo laibachii Nc14]|eukprot:CCA26687.1 AlNc14C402G11385 [Albugo laibachii Nc14]
MKCKPILKQQKKKWGLNNASHTISPNGSSKRLTITYPSREPQESISITFLIAVTSR